MIETLVDKPAEYGADQITALEGLEAVRKRPGMYIGSTGKHGLHHLVWEIVDNSVDEAMGGYATRVDVKVHEDGSISVDDDGRGIPVEPQTRGQYKGMPTVEMAMTILHAGGKFGGGAYQYSGGLHGVGTSVVNALSSWMKVRVNRNGTVWGIDFHSPVEEVEGIEKCIPGKVENPLYEIREMEEDESTGTSVHFLPDDDVFSTDKWDIDAISRRLRNTAFLNPGLTTSLTYQDVSGDEQRLEWHYPNGLKDFMGVISDERLSNEEGETPENGEQGDDDAPKAYLPEPLIFEGGDPEVGEWQICLQWFPGNQYTIDSFVNGVETSDGGTHVDGFQLSLTQMINKYCRQEHVMLLGDKDPNLEGSDIRSGLSAIIAAKVIDPQFQGQTKGRLGNDSVKRMVRVGFYDAMWKWMEEHPAEIAQVLNKCINEMRMRYRLAAAAERERSASERQGREPRAEAPPSKLNDCHTKDRSEAEMFIVEGDSAGGSAVSGRNSRTQAILPLRGKVYNVNEIANAEPGTRKYENIRSRIDSNQEIQSLINAMGTGSEDYCDVTQSRYNKVVILTDADDDGRHIQALLMTLFYRLMLPVVTSGMLYVARTPLFSATTKDGKVYAYDIEERDELDAKHKNLNWTRFKGLGEMNPDVLSEMALNPQTRRLVQVTIDDVEEAGTIVENLMGGDASKKWDALSQVEIDEEEAASL